MARAPVRPLPLHPVRCRCIKCRQAAPADRRDRFAAPLVRLAAFTCGLLFGLALLFAVGPLFGGITLSRFILLLEGH